MNYKTISILFLAILGLTLIQCKNKSISETIIDTIKFHPNDPFINSIVPSQKFDIDSKQDNVIEGINGTVIVCN